MSNPPPHRVAGHRILRKLGEGGSGAVYLAAPDDDPSRRVALKILRPGTTFSEQERRRFQREGEIGLGLDHPNILPARKIGVLDGAWVMTFEAIAGYTLADVVSAGFRAPEEEGADAWSFDERLALLADVADALAHAHAQGVVHRDVKPRNVMIRREDRHPFLIDFGLARDLRADSSLTKSGAVFGTPAYMAPEQLDGDVRRVGPASDVYALGVMIHELFAGAPPFRHATFEAQRRAVAGEEPPRLRALVPEAPAGLETLVLHTLEKRPELRPRAGVVRDQLRRLGRGEETGFSHAVHARRAARRVHHARFPLVAAAAVVLAALLGYFAVRYSDELSRVELLELSALFDQAAIDVANGELQSALVPLREAIARRPDDPTGHLEMAAAYAAFDARDEMRRALGSARARGFRAEEIDRDSARELHHLGLKLLAEQRYDEAAIALRASIAREDGPTAPHLALFRCLHLLQRHEESKQVIRSYLDSLARRSLVYPFIEAQLLELTGAPELALRRYRELDPTNLDPANRSRRRRALARVLVKQKQFGEAFAILDEHLQEETRDGAAWLQRGVVQLKLGRVDAALADGRRGARLAPRDHSRAILFVGAAWIVRDTDGAEARRILSQAGSEIDFDPLLAAQDAYDSARAAMNRGDVAAALAALARTLEFDPDHAPALTLRANEDWYAGRFREAFLGFDAAQRTYRSTWRVDGQALATWRRLQSTTYRNLRVAIHVGRFATGVEIGEEQFADHSARTVAEILDEGGDVDPVLRLNYAEALARRGSGEHDDCGLARRIVSAPGFREELGEDPAVVAVLAEIERGCP